MSVTPETTAISQLHITGNMIPLSWYQEIRMPNGKQGTKPDIYAINLLADIVYWYKHTEIRDEESGRVIGAAKKFKGDYLQRSHKQIAEFFGLSIDSSKLIVGRLSDMGLIEVIVKKRVDLPDGRMLFNVMYLKPSVDRIKEITYLSGKDSAHPRGNSSTHPRGIPSPTYTDTSSTESSSTENKVEDCRVFPPKQDFGDEKSNQSTSKKSHIKKPTSRAYHEDISEKDHPLAKQALEWLDGAMTSAAERGVKLNIAVSPHTGRPNVSREHLDVIEDNLADLASDAPDGAKGINHVTQRLTMLYNKYLNSLGKKVNFSMFCAASLDLDKRYGQWVEQMIRRGEA